MCSFNIAIYSAYYNEKVRYSSNTLNLESQAKWELKRIFWELLPIWIAFFCFYFEYFELFEAFLLLSVLALMIAVRYNSSGRASPEINYSFFFQEYRNRWFLFVLLSATIVYLDRLIISLLAPSELQVKYVVYVTLIAPISSFLSFVLIWAGKRRTLFSLELIPTGFAIASLISIWTIIYLGLGALDEFDLQFLGYFPNFVMNYFPWLIIGSVVLLMRDILMQLVFQRPDLAKLFWAPLIGFVALIMATSMRTFFPFVIIGPVLISLSLAFLLTSKRSVDGT
jgi:hypothetical protein